MCRVLLHGPIPPPMTGVGIANEMVIRELENRGVIVDCVIRGKAPKYDGRFLTWDGRISALRINQVIIEIARLLVLLFKKYVVFYISLGQSNLGILTDMFKIAFSIMGKVPIVAHVHGGRMHESIKNLNPLVRKVFLFLLKRCKNIIALTNTQGKELELFGLENIVVINNGVNPDEVCSVDRVERKLTRNQKPLNVLYLSNLIEEKGYREVVWAANELQDKDIEFRFAGQFGKSDDETWFKEKTSGLRKCRYEGVVRGLDKIALFEWADVWILPTYFIEEGLPISLLEAMWSGCAIVATYYRGIPEAVPANGVLFVEPKSKSEVRNAIDELYSDLKKVAKMGKINAIHAREHYDQTMFVNKVVGLLMVEGLSEHSCNRTLASENEK